MGHKQKIVNIVLKEKKKVDLTGPCPDTTRILK